MVGPCSVGNSSQEKSNIILIENGICVQGLVVAAATITLSYAYLIFIDELGILDMTGPPILAGVLGLLTMAVMCISTLDFQTCMTAVMNALWDMLKKIFNAFICFLDNLPAPFDWIPSIIVKWGKIDCQSI